MAEVYIKHNPYTLKTELILDGSKKENNIFEDGKHLQEWINDLPKYLLETSSDKKFNVTFHGTELDYEDVVEICKQYEKEDSTVKLTVNYEKPTEEVSDKITKITEIFEDIQNGPIKELKTPELVDAFNKAKSDEFPVNIVATMSAGKSTLLNSLLGEEIMPSSQEACTAIITNIKNNDSLTNFTAKVYDRNDKQIAESDNATLDEMTKWNGNKNVSVIDMEGNIPFVDSEESHSNLVMIDTPGPNNARNKEHEKTTWRMLGSSSKTLVLYILNATQLGTRDDKEFLTRVKKSMSVGGKQSRDRFIFVVNKLDEFKFNEDVNRTLQNVRDYLEKDIKIENPNIYAASALNALKIRTVLRAKDVNDLNSMNIMENPDIADLFARISLPMSREDHHMERYAPKIPSIKEKINTRLELAVQNDDKKEQALIHSGIPSIEEAIRLYVAKYAIPSKIANIVATFKSVLVKESVKKQLEQKISENEKLGEKLRASAHKINEKLEEVRNGKEWQSEIEKISYAKSVNNEAREIIRTTIIELNSIYSRLRGNEYDEAEAELEYRDLVAEVENTKDHLEVELNELVEDQVKDQIEELIAEYKIRIEKIVGDSDLDLDVNLPANLLNADLNANISSISQMNVQHQEEEYHFESQKKWYNPFTWLKKDRKVVDREERDFVLGDDIVNMFSGVEAMLMDYVDQITEYAKEQEEKTRNSFNKEFERLTEKMQEEMKKLDSINEKVNSTDTDLGKNRQELQWLTEMETKLNKILDI